MELVTYTEQEMSEAAKQFGESYHYCKHRDAEPDDNYKLLSTYIFGGQDNRENMMTQLKEKVAEIEAVEQ